MVCVNYLCVQYETGGGLGAKKGKERMSMCMMIGCLFVFASSLCWSLTSRCSIGRLRLSLFVCWVVALLCVAPVTFCYLLSTHKLI